MPQPTHTLATEANVDNYIRAHHLDTSKMPEYLQKAITAFKEKLKFDWDDPDEDDKPTEPEALAAWEQEQQQLAVLRQQLREMGARVINLIKEWQAQRELRAEPTDEERRIMALDKLWSHPESKKDKDDRGKEFIYVSPKYLVNLGVLKTESFMGEVEIEGHYRMKRGSGKVHVWMYKLS